MMTELPGFVWIAFYYFILQSSQLSNLSHLLFPKHSQLHLSTQDISSQNQQIYCVYVFS